VLHLLERLNREEGRTIVMVVHDNRATRHAQHLVALREGRLFASGEPHTVVAPDLLRVVFGVEADVVADPRSGLPRCLPYGLATAQAESLSIATQPIRGTNIQCVPVFAAPSAPQ